MRDGTVDQKEIYEVFGKSILPMFGLDNESATYPFVDLWGLPHGSLARAQELAKALPNDEQMLALFHYYRDLVHVIYPGVVSLELMEHELNQFITSRGTHSKTSGAVSENSVYGKNFHWLGLLFAVLASGAQTCQMPRKERELTSQVYSMLSTTQCSGFLLIHEQCAVQWSAYASSTSYRKQIWRRYRLCSSFKTFLLTT